MRRICLVDGRWWRSVPAANITHIMLVQGASTNDYGERASRDLIVTRGAGFRKEKNKKKRGSYRGGEITVSSMPRARFFFCGFRRPRDDE